MQISKKREVLQKKIKDACQECYGQGCKSCANKIEIINIYSNIGIPVLYWNLSLETFDGDENFKKRIKEFLNNINELYADGKSLVLFGSFGVGKTWAACEILKRAMNNNYSAKYITMQECVDFFVSH